MAKQSNSSTPFNVVLIGQAGRLGYEAVIFLASLRSRSPGFSGRVLVAEPQPGPLWSRDPRMPDEVRAALLALGAEIVPFENRHFGEAYPIGNKIECLQALPPEPFLFFDSDTLVTGEIGSLPADFEQPTASMKREGTWPVEELYWPGYTAIWKSLYDRFGLEFDSSLDTSFPDEFWKRYLYFNAGWFLGADPRHFGALFLEYATSIRDNPTQEMVVQPLYPWLDQIALPLVIHALGGGRPNAAVAALDHELSCHWRILPLLYARETDDVVALLEEVTAPNKIKKVLKEYEPMRRMIYQGRGHKVRAMFDRDNLPPKEKTLRNKIKAAGFWMR